MKKTKTPSLRVCGTCTHYHEQASECFEGPPMLLGTIIPRPKGSALDINAQPQVELAWQYSAGRPRVDPRRRACGCWRQRMGAAVGEA